MKIKIVFEIEVDDIQTAEIAAEDMLDFICVDGELDIILESVSEVK